MAHKPTKLIVLEGELVYFENEIKTILGLKDVHSIPVNKLHAVKASKGSLCLSYAGIVPIINYL